jgi:hypothetical protein
MLVKMAFPKISQAAIKHSVYRAEAAKGSLFCVKCSIKNPLESWPSSALEEIPEL